MSFLYVYVHKLKSVKIQVLVFDIRGAVVYKSNFKVQDGMVRLDLKNIARGVYILEIKGVQDNLHVKIIKE